ncbi:hypothetical protein F4808DRAFT_179886 [Astrocystis sublimbata]|nr:hypothetical protein F4808DRAFT_179886 [Astrocystis sublimbata]
MSAVSGYQAQEQGLVDQDTPAMPCPSNEYRCDSARKHSDQAHATQHSTQIVPPRSSRPQSRRPRHQINIVQEYQPLLYDASTELTMRQPEKHDHAVFVFLMGLCFPTLSATVTDLAFIGPYAMAGLDQTVYFMDRVYSVAAYAQSPRLPSGRNRHLRSIERETILKTNKPKGGSLRLHMLWYIGGYDEVISWDMGKVVLDNGLWSTGAKTWRIIAN